jgi:hypothetical protein
LLNKKTVSNLEHSENKFVNKRTKIYFVVANVKQIPNNLLFYPNAVMENFMPITIWDFPSKISGHGVRPIWLIMLHAGIWQNSF